MDILLICRDASASSVLTNVWMAIQARKAGKESGIIFTEDALAGVAGGMFSWPRALQGEKRRLTIADESKELGLPLMGQGQGRQLHAEAVIPLGLKEGVAMMACPLWSRLLGSDGLPEGIEPIDTATALRLVATAGRVVGSF